MSLRVTLISILLGATIFLNYKTSDAFSMPSAQFLTGLIATTYLSTIVFAIWYRFGTAIQLLARVQLFMDLLVWACLTYATGGVVSGFTALFDLWVIVWAIVLGGRAAFQAALTSSVIFTVLAIALYTGVLSPLSDQPTLELTGNAFAYFLGVNISALFIVAFLVHSLVSRLERTGEGLEAERIRRADIAQLHEDTIRSLTVGIATTDLSRRVITMNPAGLVILGALEEDVEDTPIDEWLPDLKGQLIADIAIRSQGHGLAVAKDQRKIPVEYIVAPLSTADGKERGFIVVFSDLTEMRKLEAALEKSRRLAALGELAASLAHEIRNPLGAMSGAFQILASNPNLGEEDRSLTEIITREIRRMEQLISDVLEYSLPKKPELIPVNLSELLQEVFRMFAMDDEAKERVIHADIDRGITHSLNSPKMKQVIWNLLRNALQATEPGEQITLRAKKMENEIKVEVIDTGRGIAPNYIQQIFDPFFTTRELGLGLGLALCRRIVTEHQGTIAAELRDGVGTVFRITLPIAS